MTENEKIELFDKWYDENYKPVSGETVDIDKDILLPGNMEYGPASARFAPHCINTLILGADRESKLPTGVDLHDKKYRARVNHRGNRIECGSFDTIEEAAAAYKKCKAKIIR